MQDLLAFVKMHRGSAAVYFGVLATSLSANKFVLSSLGFQYPMVFQVRASFPWQTIIDAKLLQTIK